MFYTSQGDWLNGEMGGWDWGGGDVTALSIVLLTCFAHRDKVHYVTTGTDET